MSLAIQAATQTAAPQSTVAPQEVSITSYLPKLDELRRAENWVGVENLARQAIAALQVQSATKAADIATARYRLAEAFRGQGNYRSAETLLREMVAIDEKAPNPENARTAADLGFLGEILMAKGSYTEAAAAERRALTIDEKVSGPNNPHTMNDTNNLGEALFLLGRYKDVEPLLQRTLATDRRTLGPDNPDTIQVITNLSALLTQEGRYAEAETLIREALASDDRSLGPEKAHAARDMTQLAFLLQAQSRLSEAEMVMRRALVVDEKIFGPEHRDTATTVDILAFILLRQKRYVEAEPLLRRALAIRQKVLGVNHPDTLASESHLAYLFAEQGHYREAERSYRQALAAAEKSLGPESVDAGLADFYVASALDGQGRFAEADPLYRHAALIHLNTLGPQNPQTLLMLQYLAYNDYYLQKFEDAVLHFRMVCEYRAARRALDQNSIALQASRSAVGACSSQLSLSLWEWSMKGGGAKPADRPEALKIEAFRSIQRSMQSAGGVAMSHSAAVKAAVAAGVGAQAEAYESALQERDELDAKFSSATSGSAELRGSLTAARADVTSRIDRLAEELQAKAPLYWNYRAPQMVTVDALQSTTGADAGLLNDDEALIVFLAATGRYKGLVFAVSKQRAAWARLGLSGDELTTAVAKLRRQIDPEGYGLQQATVAQGGRPGAFDRQAAYTLYRQLLGDPAIQNVIQGKPTWLFVPSGALTSLPPGLFVTAPPGGGRAKDADPASLRATAWLLRSKAVALLPAVSVLRTFRGLGSADRPKTPDPLLAFADPDFSRPAAPKNNAVLTATRGFKAYFRDGLPLAEALDDVPSLPGTRIEGEALEQVMQGRPGSLLTGKDASKAQLMARNKDGRLGQVQVLEFATHGLVAGDASDLAEPALVLAAGNSPQDELLLASEAATLKIHADWVLLSACNTASPDSPEAQGLSGLSRAFFYAGARSLLVSHWRVRDDVAPILIPAMLLAERQHPEMSHAQSLQQASLAVLDNLSIDAADPSAWAAFTLIGDPRR